MAFSYEDSVLEYADDDGNLSLEDTKRLLSDHGVTLAEFYEFSGYIASLNADDLLAFLGY